LLSACAGSGAATAAAPASAPVSAALAPVDATSVLFLRGDEQIKAFRNEQAASDALRSMFFLDRGKRELQTNPHVACVRTCMARPGI